MSYVTDRFRELMYQLELITLKLQDFLPVTVCVKYNYTYSVNRKKTKPLSFLRYFCFLLLKDLIISHHSNQK